MMYSEIGWAESLTLDNVRAGPAVRQAATGLMITLPHPSDENEHDHDPRETPKAESCGCSQ
jgi:hypothetical protein